MPDIIQDTLAECTTKIAFEDKKGTGFFISEHWGVTCAHVLPVKFLLKDFFDFQSQDGSAHKGEIIYLDRDPDLDICIFYCDECKASRFVVLNDEYRLGDRVFGYGYPVYGSTQNEDGFYGTAESTLQTKSQSGMKVSLHKIRHPDIRGGFSGSPIINLNSGLCIGMMAESTRSGEFGLAVTAKSLLEILQNLPGYLPGDAAAMQSFWKKICQRSYDTARLDSSGDVMFGDQKLTNIHYSAQWEEMKVRQSALDRELLIIQQEIKANPYINYFHDKLSEINAKREKSDLEIREFKDEVLKLAKDFATIPSDSERLQVAKQFFEQGRYKEAKDALDAPSLETEMNILLQEKRHLQDRNDANRRSLEDKANEFLILARLAKIEFSVPDRFQRTVNYYELSVKASANFENQFELGQFLKEQHHYLEAKPLLEAASRISKDEFKGGLPGCVNHMRALEGLCALYFRLQDSGAAVLTGDKLFRFYESLNDDLKATVANYYCSALVQLSNLYASRNDFEKAKQFLAFALNLVPKTANLDDESKMHNIAVILQNLSVLYSFENHFQEALDCLTQAFEIERPLAVGDPERFMPSLAQMQLNLAKVYHKLRHFSDARILNEAALQNFRILAGIDLLAYMPQVAQALGELGDLFSENSVFPDPLILYNESLDIYRRLAAREPKSYSIMVSGALKNISEYYISRKEYATAENILKEALKLETTFVEENPELFLPELASTENNLAVVYKETRRNSLASEFYERSLSRRRKLAGDKPAIYKPALARSAANTANFYVTTGEFEKAERLYLESLDIRRTLVRISPEAFRPDLAHTANSLSDFYMRCIPNRSRAVALAMEAIENGLPYAGRMPNTNLVVQNAIKNLAELEVDAESFLKTLEK